MQHRIAAPAAVGRDRERGAVGARGDAPVGLGADERLVGETDDDCRRSRRAASVRAATRPAGSTRCPPRASALRTHLGIRTARPRDPVVGDDDDDRPERRSPAPRRARARPAAGRRAQRAASVRRRRSAAPRPAARTTATVTGALRSGSDGFERAADEHAREVLAVLGRRVEVAASVRCLRPRARPRRPRTRPARAPARPRVARSGVRPMFTSATCVPPFDARRDRADDRPVLGAPVELLVREARRAGLGHADLGEQLVGRERGLEEAEEEVGRGDRRARRSGPAPRTSASSASSTAGRSEAGSPCATEPPSVPRCRTWLSPTCAATARSTPHSLREQVARSRGRGAGSARRSRRGRRRRARTRGRGHGRRRRARSASPAAASSAGSATCRRRGTWRPRRARR